MPALNKRSYSIGTKSCDVWIVEIPRENKEPLVMVSAHGIAELLGYKQPDKAVRNHISMKHKQNWSQIKTRLSEPGLEIPPNWHPHTVFITEPAIYKLCTKSTLPEAEEFQDWIYEKVLPSIRKTGGYNVRDRNGTSVAEYDKKLADGQMELMKAQLLVANLQTQLSNHGAEITQTVAKYDGRIAELQLENEKVMSALKSEHQREIAVLKEHEFKLHLALRDMIGNANNATAQFFANALLADDNIAENEQLRTKLGNVRDRVSPDLPNRPDKQEVLMLNEYENAALQTVIRSTRTQRKEIENLEKIRERYALLPAGTPPPSKRYRWVAKARKVFEFECANAVTVWNRVRADNPHLFYGLPYVNNCKTEMVPLTEPQLRAKYADDVRMCERNLKSCAHSIAEFEALGLLDAEDCVRRCLVDPTKSSSLIKEAVERVVRNLERETEVASEPVRRENASERYTAEQLRNCVQNYGNYCINNVFNINFFAGAAPATAIALNQ
ncbi:anti-repressor Ant [Heliothis virescens ascovirus 3f]|uniref:Bro19 n=1 Tax=Heliothis virescens ascovirus 3f TaxID=328614 RepID=A0A171PVR0_9VIRU|nr:anti-repressor Ant [Heliothis virescens ascovirus 3f]AJP09120.1 Bro19 [Heliothis virescens ascovirus 3f]